MHSCPFAATPIYEKVCTGCAKLLPSYKVWWLRQDWVWTSVSWCNPAPILWQWYSLFYSILSRWWMRTIKSRWSGRPAKNNDLLLSARGFKVQKYKTIIARQNFPVLTPKDREASANRVHLANSTLSTKKNKKCMRYAQLPVRGDSNTWKGMHKMCTIAPRLQGLMVKTRLGLDQC